MKFIVRRSFLAILCIATLLPGDFAFLDAQQPSASTPAEQPAKKIPADQLDSLVAPIALYPDPMLAQTLAASTYPLEIIQLYQWLEKNKSLKDKALADAVMKQPWDPSVQALAGLPDVVKRLAEDIQWTADLGNAFLAQQSDVMDAVQRMRHKAEEKGNLKSTEQVRVETKVIESKEVIVVEQANPQVIYVPTYDPVVVYGAPVYPYPPIYYPPPGYYAAGMAVAWGAGFAMGAFWGGGGWGWGCGWGGNDIDIDIDNNFNRNTNIDRNRNTDRTRNTDRSGNRQQNRGQGGNREKWQHNSKHRGGAPYSDRNTANKFGGNARGDSLSNRQSSARQQVNQQGGNLRSNTGNRNTGSQGRDYQGGSRSGNYNRGSSSYNRPYSGSSSSNRVGSRDMSTSRGSGSNRNAMGSGSRSGYSGSRTRSSSSRGSRSMGGSRGGGGRRR